MGSNLEKIPKHTFEQRAAEISKIYRSQYQLLEKRQTNITKKMMAIKKEIERVETKTENKE